MTTKGKEKERLARVSHSMSLDIKSTERKWYQNFISYQPWTQGMISPMTNYSIRILTARSIIKTFKKKAQLASYYLQSQPLDFFDDGNS